MNDDRADQADHANCQGSQDRDVMNLYHYLQDNKQQVDKPAR
jgi:hypothetical protein